MRKSVLIAAAALIVGIPSAANAASCVVSGGVEMCTFTPGSAQFRATFDADGTIGAAIGRNGIGGLTDIGPGTGSKAHPLTFQDTYLFLVGATGLGSASLITTASVFHSTTDLDFTSITFNGAPLTRSPNGLFEYAFIPDVPIVDGLPNYLVIRGTARGNGSYGGNISFTPTVPEPSTWAMMLMGFGFMGGAMRAAKRKPKATVSYA